MATDIPGTPVHVDGASTDASSGLNLIPKESASVSTMTLAGRVIAITDLTIIAAVGGTVTLDSRTSTGTLVLFSGVLTANGGLARTYRSPCYGLRGGSLVLTATAGDIRIQAEGVLVY